MIAPIKIAFLFQDPSLWPAWESLYFALINDSRFIVSVFQTEKREFTYEKQKSFLGKVKVPCKIFSEQALDEFAPDIAFLQTPYDYLGRPVYAYSLRLKNKGIRVIYVPYGIEIVDTPSARYDHFRTPAIRNAYRIYVLSEAFAQEYKKYCGNYKAVRAFGLPRFDMLCHKEQFKLSDSLKERIMGRPVVVWHTHFAKVSFMDGANRQITPYLEEYMDFAKKLLEYNQYFFIFLPHPKFGNDLVDKVSNEKSLEVMEVIQAAENAYIDQDDDYRPSLLNANAVITDRSSLMIEAAICGCQVLLLHNPDYQEQIFKPLVPLTDSFYHGTNCNDMCAFLDMLKNGDDPQKSAREKAFKNCIPYMDGKCADRIKEDIYNSLLAESLDENKGTVKNHKLILFGTGFLYQKVMENFEIPSTCEIIALSDNNRDKWGSSLNGFQIIPPENIQETDFDKIVIMATNVFEEQIYKQLRFDLEIPANKIEFCEYLAELSTPLKKA